MPRLVKATAREIQRARRDWYSFHFEQHMKALALPALQIQTYITAIGFFEKPTLTIFGGLPGDWPDRKAFQIAGIWNLDVNLMNQWYLTAPDWEKFQEMWQQLPEPIDVRTNPSYVQIGPSITLSHMPAYANPPD